MPAIHTVAGSAASGTAGATVAFAGGTGDDFIVKSFPETAEANLELVVAEYTTANTLQIRSPALHDVESAIDVYVKAATPREAIPRSFAQKLKSQDTLIVELVQAAALGVAETEVVALSMYYSNLTGQASRLHMPGDIAGNIRYIRTAKVSVTTSATPGDWASSKINSTNDIWHANQDYAVLGYLVDGACTAVAFHGDDTGNLKVGGPGSTTYLDTRDYFYDMSEKRGTPHIPVINAANRGGTYVDVVAQAASATVDVYVILAELLSPLS